MKQEIFRIAADVYLLAESRDQACYRLGRYLIQSAQGKKLTVKIDGELRVGPLEDGEKKPDIILVED